MYNPGKVLTETAVKRLNVIKEFTELGSGFSIATRDLSIRGAGDILGSEQAGFIDSVGIDLYLKMLNEAICKSKGEIVEDNDGDNKKNDKPLISVSTHIDDNYVSDGELKIAIHKMINEVDSISSFNKIKDELEDRFGKLNDELIIYMYEEWFEKLAKSVGIIDVVDGKNSIDMTLSKENSSKINGELLFNDAYTISRMFRFSYNNGYIHIILDKVKLDEHYIIYLIKILNRICDMIN
jgi:transcription-repair coupling factor (superfamily II helicase)